MSEADRRARELRKQHAALLDAKERTDAEAALRRRDNLLVQVDTLAESAVEKLENSPNVPVEAFRVRPQRGQGLFTRDRGGWMIGSINGSIGYGAEGTTPIPVYLLSTGDFIHAGWGPPGALRSTWNLDNADDRELAAVVEMLRKIVG